MVLAQEAAQRRGINYIGPEEIFAAAIDAGESPASAAAEDLGITQPALRKAEQALERRTVASGAGEIIFTPEGKRVIEWAFEKARELHHNYIGAEHLVLSYLDLSKGEGELLRALDVDADALRSRILELTPKQAPTHIRVLAERTLDGAFQSKPPSFTPAELWLRLKRAVENQDPASAFAYAFFIAQHCGWTAAGAVDAVQRFLEEPPG